MERNRGIVGRLQRDRETIEEKLKRMNETEDTSMAVTGAKWGIQGQLKNK